jgi:hypothetical protein
MTAHVYRTNFFMGFQEVKIRLQQKEIQYNINKKFWEELLAYFPFIIYSVLDTTRTAQKTESSNSFIVACIRCYGNMFIKPLPNNGAPSGSIIPAFRR